MIVIKDKENCCGCGACSNVCPKSCIRMQEDEEGFLYPIADSLLCINCGKCEKVCPVSNPSEAKASEAVFAAKNVSDEARMKSSSGGAFVKLAEMVLQEGGVVFGACFDNHFEVEHSYVEETSSLGKLLGSKYVQSKMGDCFQKVKQFLEIGRKVLFSGTSCQVAGLKSFLGHEEYPAHWYGGSTLNRWEQETFLLCRSGINETAGQNTEYVSVMLSSRRK